MLKCNCGGGLGLNHTLGTDGCLREKVHAKPRKISGEDDRWFVDGHTITGFTLTQQRGYYLHDYGSWSRPKDHESTNSLLDET
jgi:hypothetical protein